MNFSALSALAASALLLACGKGDDNGAPDAGQQTPDAGQDSGDAAASGDAGIEGGVQWPSAACQANTAALLAKMTRLQKAQQMVMANDPPAGDVTSNAPGAVFGTLGVGLSGGTDVTAWAAWTDGYVAEAAKTPLPIPILFGLDAVHGNDGATGTVIFPHNAGLAASRNAAFVFQVAQVEASEILAAGVTWTFAPFSGTTWDYRWGRVYESFSEDPTWAGEMLTAEIQGFQGVGGLGSRTSLMACSKHAAGDGQAGPPSMTNGIVDRGQISIDTPTMEKWGLAQYVPAIRAGVGCIMVSDAYWNGTSMTYGASGATMLGLLKGSYGFKGFVVTDWDSANGNEAAAINNGVDMLMAPDEPWTTAISKINESTFISDARIDDAVTRILNAKCQAGLFQLPGGPPAYKRDPSLIADVGSAAHRALGRQAVQQSLVLLQNGNSALPIAKTANVYVGGSGANSLDNQCGGWTMLWQGNGAATTGTTIQQAIANVKPPVPTMAAADVVVIVLSEHPYAESRGDSPTLDTLPAADFTLLEQARASGKKVVAVILSGRPVLINSPNHPNALSNADAWIAAWLPGTEGDGVADVLFGDYHPTGKLSHSWPADDASANIMCGTGYAGLSCPGGYKPLYPLGFGLTY
jgi:beta-glucosidase